MRPKIVAFLAGLIFAIGLGVSGMTQPSKVIGFLDFFGNWDPSLIFVMGGAIGAHFLFARRAAAGGRPRLAPRFELPTRRDIDAKLLVGAALFGLGWGIAGFCPGPAVVSVVTGARPALVFVGAMIATMFLYRWLARQRASAGDRNDQAEALLRPGDVHGDLRGLGGSDA